MLAWVTSFVWTLALELPVYTLLVGRCFRTWWGVVALVAAINLATHPALWLVLSRVPSGWYALAIGEGAVAIVESIAVALAIGRWRDAFAAAVVANGCSFAIGLLLWSLV